MVNTILARDLVSIQFQFIWFFGRNSVMRFVTVYGMSTMPNFFNLIRFCEYSMAIQIQFIQMWI